MNNATSHQPAVASALPPARMVQLAQGSPEWLAYRLAKRNASESAAVMGLNPWMTPYQLWLAKTGRQQTVVTAAMQRGTDLEPIARARYEEQTGLVMQPLVLEAGPYSASLDGMTLDGDLVLEVKCPFKGSGSVLWRDVSAGQVPQHGNIQIQHQLMVSGADMAHLWVFDGERGLLHSVERDDGLMQGIRAAWDGFQQYLGADTPPPRCEGDTVQRNDELGHGLAAALHRPSARPTARPKRSISPSLPSLRRHSTFSNEALAYRPVVYGKQGTWTAKRFRS